MIARNNLYVETYITTNEKKKLVKQFMTFQ